MSTASSVYTMSGMLGSGIGKWLASHFPITASQDGSEEEEEDKEGKGLKMSWKKNKRKKKKKVKD